MWLRLEEDQIQTLSTILSAELLDSDLDMSCRTHLESLKVALSPESDADAEAFRSAVETSDELEVDSDAAVSRGEDGAFVMSWSWVSNEQAGIEPEEDASCENCGSTDNDGTDTCSDCGGTISSG